MERRWLGIGEAQDYVLERHGIFLWQERLWRWARDGRVVARQEGRRHLIDAASLDVEISSGRLPPYAAPTSRAAGLADLLRRAGAVVTETRAAEMLAFAAGAPAKRGTAGRPADGRKRALAAIVKEYCGVTLGPRVLQNFF